MGESLKFSKSSTFEKIQILNFQNTGQYKNINNFQLK